MGKKIEVLLPHIVAFEESFDSRPGDVMEHRRRDGLIRYVMTVPLVPRAMLNSIERPLAHRGRSFGEAEVAATLRSH